MTVGAASSSSVAAPRALSRVETGEDKVQRGERGEDVREMQKLLNQHGAGLAEDGAFGPLTQGALKKFQAAHGLDPTGECDQQTLQSLCTPPDSPARPRATTPGQPPLPPEQPGAPSPYSSDPPSTPAPAPAPAPSTPSAGETPHTGPAIPRGTMQPPIDGYKPCTKITPAVVQKANEVLKRSDLPIGSTVPFEANGKKYIARVEWHKHPPSDPVPAALKDWHRGVSIYEAK